ncbi:MAG: ABC transporter permease, partial [Sphaerochaetaceae bacterium]
MVNNTHSIGKSILLTISLVFIVLLGLSALAAPLISGYDPTDQNLSEILVSPGEGGHLLGTDDLGRDVFSRLLYGSRSALIVGSVTVVVALVLGLVFGLLAGLGGRKLDGVIMIVNDSLLSFPTILLALTIVTFMGYGLGQVMLAMGVIFSPVFTRIVRAEALVLRHAEFVEAATIMGTKKIKIICLHIIPNMIGKLIVQSAITFASSIVVESSLSYLGLGIQPPDPSWGLMLKDARSYILTAPRLAMYP